MLTLHELKHTLFKYTKVFLKTISGLLLATAYVSTAHTSETKICQISNFKAPENATLTSAKVFTAPVNYCRVDGYVTTTNPGPNHVRFMVALPENFNDRYVFTIQGGSGAFVPDPSEDHLKAGYAIASTDKGVKAAHGLDFTFRNDPAQTLDWAHRGVHVSAQATQNLTKQFYQTDKLNRYAMGCSGGGDGTLSAAENHPADFDAYIAAAMTTAPLEIITWWGKLTQNIVKNPNAWLSAQELAQVEQVFMEQYDAADGAIDGLIWDPTVIKLDRNKLAFLNDDQFNMLKMMQTGIHAGNGADYPGYWLGNPTGFTSFVFGTKRPPWGPQDRPPAVPAGWLVADSGSKAIRGQDYNMITDMDFTSSKALLADRKLNESKGRETFKPQDLQAMKDSGSKIIFWSGSSDQAVPPQNILNYTTAANKVYGEKDRTDFMQTYLVPGMFHCHGGVGQPTDTPNIMLDAAVKWVEDGITPSNLVVNRVNQAGEKERRFLLCPWPQKSVFTGGVKNPEKLDLNDASNWNCQ